MVWVVGCTRAGGAACVWWWRDACVGGAVCVGRVGAALVSLAAAPQVKFGLDFGPALGGRYTARPVAAFLDPFLRDTLANALVWPQR